MRRNMNMPDREWSKNMWARIAALIDGQGQAIAGAIKAITFNGGNVPPDATGRVTFAESDPTVPAWAKAATKPTYTAQEVGALPSTTVIPNKTSSLTNDGDGTSPFATMADIPAPQGNDCLILQYPDIRTTADLQQALIDADMDNGESCTFYADYTVVQMITNDAAETANGASMVGVINGILPQGGNRTYYYMGYVSRGAGIAPLIAMGNFAFSLDAVPSVLTVPYMVIGTPMTVN